MTWLNFITGTTKKVMISLKFLKKKEEKKKKKKNTKRKAEVPEKYIWLDFDILQFYLTKDTSNLKRTTFRSCFLFSSFRQIL